MWEVLLIGCLWCWSVCSVHSQSRKIFARRNQIRHVVNMGAKVRFCVSLPLEQSGPKNPGKQWHIPERQSPFPWQFWGHSIIDSDWEKERERERKAYKTYIITEGILASITVQYMTVICTQTKKNKKILQKKSLFSINRSNMSEEQGGPPALST